jgi:hypothetical protein
LAFSGYKAREDEESQGWREIRKKKKHSRKKDRTGGGKEEEEQTCIPLFLLKETEEAKEKAMNKRK